MEYILILSLSLSLSQSLSIGLNPFPAAHMEYGEVWEKGPAGACVCVWVFVLFADIRYNYHKLFVLD